MRGSIFLQDLEYAQGRTQEFEKGISRVGMVVHAWIIETHTCLYYLWFAYAQKFKLLTLGAHAPEGYSTVCIVAPRAIRCRNSSSSDFSAIRA